MATVKWREGLEYKLHIDYSIKTFRFDWSDWLAEINADTLLSAVFHADAGLATTGKLDTATYTEITVAPESPAAVGDSLVLTCVANTADGQSDPRSITMKIVDSL